jgi:hypothetical protein
MGVWDSEVGTPAFEGRGEKQAGESKGLGLELRVWDSQVGTRAFGERREKQARARATTTVGSDLEDREK